MKVTLRPDGHLFVNEDRHHSITFTPPTLRSKTPEEIADSVVLVSHEIYGTPSIDPLLREAVIKAMRKETQK